MKIGGCTKGFCGGADAVGIGLPPGTGTTGTPF